MTASTTLQLKISRTRKRLSNNTWYLPIIIVASAGLMIYLSYTLRAISMAGRYGLVEAEIPVLPVPLSDETLTRYKEEASQVLDQHTSLILLTKEAFIYGTAESFAGELTVVRSKFYVPHVEGAPNLPRLVEEMTRWHQEIGTTQDKAVLIFIPLEEIPMPIVIQCMSAFTESHLFKKVVMGGGLI